MILELTEKEREILRIALESFEDDIKGERMRTDKKEWRYALRGEEDVIKRILEKVSAPAA